jgi:HPt (histidine-containing phosphotransfer) domain-containing protein
MMPEMDGVEATKIIREMGLSVPIIALTANAVSGSKEMVLEGGMNDYLSKPILRTELTKIIKKWTPSEKLMATASEAVVSSEDRDEECKELWIKIEQIEEISVSTGLDRVDGHWDVYEKMLKLMIQEIEKAHKNLNEFLRANDMSSFYVEAHGIKGALANIGAMGLSKRASDFEVASNKKDVVFCAENLPSFLEKLGDFNLKLKEVFSVITNDATLVIPSELPKIFERLIGAFAETDLMLIDKETEKLDALNLSGVLKEEIEQIKDMVMMMNYDEATEQIRRLLGNVQRLDFSLIG